VLADLRVEFVDPPTQRVELLPDRGDVFVPHRTVLSGRFDRVAWSFPGESIRQHNCTPHDEDHAEYDDLEPRVAVRPEYRVEHWVKHVKTPMIPAATVAPRLKA